MIQAHANPTSPTSRVENHFMELENVDFATTVKNDCGSENEAVKTNPLVFCTKKRGGSITTCSSISRCSTFNSESEHEDDCDEDESSYESSCSSRFSPSSRHSNLPCDDTGAHEQQIEIIEWPQRHKYASLQAFLQHLDDEDDDDGNDQALIPNEEDEEEEARGQRWSPHQRGRLDESRCSNKVVTEYSGRKQALILTGFVKKNQQQSSFRGSTVGRLSRTSSVVNSMFSTWIYGSSVFDLDDVTDFNAINRFVQQRHSKSSFRDSYSSYSKQ